MSSDLLLEDFKKNCCYRLDESLRMVEKSLALVDEHELWKKPNSSLNSIANLILHLCGNMTQYVVSGVGKHPDLRDRNNEFTQDGNGKKAELLLLLQATVTEVKHVLNRSSEADLLPLRRIQGFELSGIGAVIHAVEHFSYHTGQIAFWVKYLKNSDLGFYEGMDLSQINS